MIASLTSSGRDAAIARRRAQSVGKAGLPASTERSRSAAPSPAPVAALEPAPAAAAMIMTPPPETAALDVPPVRVASTGRLLAQARRTALSQHGRGDLPPARPSRLPREGHLEYAAKVVASTTQSGQRVTGLRIGDAAHVTGIEPGARQPISGTPYIGTDSSAAQRFAAPKIGFARTPSGIVVSGTQVRSRIAITGDEAAPQALITGESEQGPNDDLSDRTSAQPIAEAQFRRQVDPHGHSVFGTNLGRAAMHIGSRSRPRTPALEATDTGLAITGSALGRSVRVTGDESGACQRITGDQYLSPAQRQSECGGRGGGTAAAVTAADRPDPVTGAKVRVASTWGRQRVTGPDVEHRPSVTGDEPGSCRVVTGTPYQGPNTLEAWCDDAAVDDAHRRLPKAAARHWVTGDLPCRDDAVTGNLRGAERSLTGTPYGDDSGGSSGRMREVDGFAAAAAGFSVRSPQRTAHARRQAEATMEAPEETSVAITGSFAMGHHRVTGNTEFQPRLRKPPAGAQSPAHSRLTGEGRVGGRTITGDAWRDLAKVTGTEGAFSANRNPSERSGERHGFAGAIVFKGKAKHEDRRQLVTGMIGGSAKAAAVVTLSGGAQG